MQNGLLADFRNDLSLAEIKALTENASYLGRKWLNLLPIQKSARFTDPEFTEAIRSRLLAPVRPLDHPCGHCGNRTNIGHEDICKGAVRKYTARHDQITKAIVKSLKSRPDLQVEFEPEGDPPPLLRTATLAPTQQPINLNGSGSPITTPIRSAPRTANGKRADFSVINGNSRYYYDVQIVAINKDSARDTANDTLTEAANAKNRTYTFLKPFFHPLVISAGGLMEKSSAQAYKQLQKLMGPVAAHWMDTSISLTLLRSRTFAATSIAKVIPRRI